MYSNLMEPDPPHKPINKTPNPFQRHMFDNWPSPSLTQELCLEASIKQPFAWKIEIQLKRLPKLEHFLYPSMRQRQASANSP